MKEENIGERLRKRRLELGMSVEDVARMLGKNRATVYRYENSSINAMPSDVLSPLAKALQMTPEELMGWQKADFPRKAEDLVLPHAFHSIPIIGCVRAGWNGPAYEEKLGTDFADVCNPQEYFYLRVEGDSMAPHINEGDLALIHIQSVAESGDIVVALIEGECGTIKKYIRRGGTIILQPFNPAYEAMVFSGSETDNVTIVGKVIETKRKW